MLVLKESSLYSPDHLDELICLAIDQLGMSGASGYDDIEVSISLTATDDENVRPSLHLSIDTVNKLSSIKASFDFDPYV